MALLIITLLFPTQRKHNVHQLAQTFSCSYKSHDLTLSLMIIIIIVITPASQSVSQTARKLKLQQLTAAGVVDSCCSWADSDQNVLSIVVSFLVKISQLSFRLNTIFIISSGENVKKMPSDVERQCN